MFYFVKIKNIFFRKHIKKGNRLRIKKVYLKNKIIRKLQYVQIQQNKTHRILNLQLRMSLQIISNFQTVILAVKGHNNQISKKI